MARSLAALSLGFALLVGCQQQAVTVDPLPTPNLDGPVVGTFQPQPQTLPQSSPVTPKAQTQARAADVPEGWIPVGPANQWRWIVIHHSAGPSGCAAAFDRDHRHKGWDELGYHFVIGNGAGSADGQIEVGPRWIKQKWGAHAKTPDNRYNDYGIGICLVGNFDLEHPTPAQLRSLTKLTTYLMKTYRIPPSCVVGHNDTKATCCPGRNLHVADIRRQLIPLARELGIADPWLAETAQTDLLKSAPCPK